jgi:hypothetical protein
MAGAFLRSTIGWMADPVRKRVDGRRRPAVGGLKVRPAQLRRRVKPGSLPFRTTAEVEPLAGMMGQPRALGAIEFGLAVETEGYNLFVASAPDGSSP